MSCFKNIRQNCIRLFSCGETMEQEQQEQDFSVSVLDLPDSLLLKVFMLLSVKSLRCVSLTCSRFNCIAQDEQLWKKMLQEDFAVPKSIPLRPQACSWRAEYRRLHDESPSLLCDEVWKHEDEVLHVSFSPDGRMFATCSKDSTVRVWNARTPCKKRFVADLGQRCMWRYTRSSKFNNSGTLLLVVGVVELGRTLKGEVVVFDLEQDFKLVSRRLNTPHNLYSAWYDDSHFLSGTLRNISDHESISALWLSKASRKVTSDRKYAITNTFRFKNHGNSCARVGHVRMIMVADAPLIPKDQQFSHSICSDHGHHSIPATSTETFAECEDDRRADSFTETGVQSDGKHVGDGYVASANPETITMSDISDSLPKHQLASSGACSSGTRKLLIFTLGLKTYCAHAVGIKRMTEEEIREEEEAVGGLDWPTRDDEFLPNRINDIADSKRFADVDYTFDMHGQIIGMALSPDQRYLYVNRRRWQDEDNLENEMFPSICMEIDILVIDLVTLTMVDTIYRSHKAISDGRAYLYLDVNDLYVVSGAEDNKGYMWDRHYGVPLRTFPHDDSVNCCAFNPVNPEMLVTASDDFSIRIWRSRRQMRELKLQPKQSMRPYCQFVHIPSADES